MRRVPLLVVSTMVMATTGPAPAGAPVTEPLFTKSAQRHPAPVIEASVESYRGRDFEEIESVDASEVRLGLVMPVFSDGQLRLSLPVHTDGDGERIETGGRTDLSGNGGTFDFASVTYEHAFNTGTATPIHWMGYVGLGIRTARLKTSHGDYMNHRGMNANLGVRMERRLAGPAALLADVGYQYYWDTDDLNPADDGTSFGHLRASAALIMRERAWQPVLELAYRGDASGYHNLAIVPELLYSSGAADFKFGVPVGLTNDADDYALTLGFSYRM